MNFIPLRVHSTALCKVEPKQKQLWKRRCDHVTLLHGSHEDLNVPKVNLLGQVSLKLLTYNMALMTG